MKPLFGIVALAALLLAGCTATTDEDTSPSSDPPGVDVGVVSESGEQEREITLEDVPDAVRDAILREAGEHEIRDVEAIEHAGQIFYEASWRVGDMETEIAVTIEGEVIGRETEAAHDPEDGEGEDDEDDASEDADDSDSEDAGADH